MLGGRVVVCSAHGSILRPDRGVVLLLVLLVIGGWFGFGNACTLSAPTSGCWRIHQYLS